MQAKVGYLSGNDFAEDATYQPEAQAKAWFQATYPTGTVIAWNDFVSTGIPADITTLWINIDRQGSNWAATGWDNQTLKDKVGTFVKNRGHLFVTSHAVLLANLCGRGTQGLALEIWDANWSQGGDIWQANTNMCGRDNSDHAIFDGLGLTGDNKKFDLVGADMRTDHNVMWGDIDEAAQGCKRLATWGQETNCDHAGIVEFLPKGEYQGHIIACGLAAYQWGKTNSKIDNVQKLTSNTLSYLESFNAPEKVPNPAAETAFLLMTTSDISTSADVTAAIAALPSAPERNAAKEFAKTYFAETEQESEGRYISLSELSRIPDSVKTIIIHADRTELFNWSSYTETLKTWVKERGGNLVLLRQATILASEMNRIDYAPYCQALSNDATGDNNPGSNQYDKIRVKMGIANISDCSSYDPCSVDRSGDDLFANMTIVEAGDDKLITLNNGGPAKNRCYWQEILGNNAESATYSRVKFEEFQTRYNCEVLAVEGYVQDFCLASIIRFNRGTVPADSSAKWKGSILAIGAGGFQYTDDNSDNFGTMNTLVESAVESIKVSPCENCFRITFH